MGPANAFPWVLVVLSASLIASPSQAEETDPFLALSLSLEKAKDLQGLDPSALSRDLRSQLSHLEESLKSYSLTARSSWGSDTFLSTGKTVAFQGLSSNWLPDRSLGVIACFEGRHRLTSARVFSLGWRVEPTGSTTSYDPYLHGIRIQVEVGSQLTGKPLLRQVYGLQNDQIFLLWIEDLTGELVRNLGDWPYWNINPGTPTPRPLDLPSLLFSQRRMETLAALTLLSTDPRTFAWRSPTDARHLMMKMEQDMVAMHQSPEVQAHLLHLKSSPHLPTRMAAQLAASPFSFKQSTSQVLDH